MGFLVGEGGKRWVRGGGGQKSGFVVGQDSSDGVSEGRGVAEDVVRFGRCHVADWGDLKCDC